MELEVSALSRGMVLNIPFQKPLRSTPGVAPGSVDGEELMPPAAEYSLVPLRLVILGVNEHLL